MMKRAVLLPVLVVAAGALVLLQSCTLGAPRETGSGFMFALEPISIVHQGAQKQTLIVMQPTTSPELDSARIALRMGPRWDYYAAARWSDFLPALVQDKFTKSLAAAHIFKTVAADESGLTGDVLLKTEIRSFQAEYPSGAGVAPMVHIQMVINLVTRLERAPITSFTITAQKRAAGNTLSAVQAAFAAAFNEAEAELVEKMGNVHKTGEEAR